MSSILSPVTRAPFPLVGMPVGGSMVAPANSLVRVTAGGAAVTVQAPANPVQAMTFGVVDGDGSAGTVPITVDGNGNQIAGGATTQVNTANDSAVFIFDAGAWRALLPVWALDGTNGERIEFTPKVITPTQVAAQVQGAQNAIVPVVTGPTGWWQAPFGGVPWLAAPPPGPYVANGSLVAQGSAATVGAALINGMAPAHLDGVATALRSSAGAPALIAGNVANTDPFSCLCFFRCDTSSSSAFFASCGPLMTDDSTHWGVVVDNARGGIRLGAWGGGTDESAAIAYTLGTYAMASWRYDGTTMFLDVSTPAARSSVTKVRTVGPGVQRATAGQFMRFGVEGDNSGRISGDFAEILTWNRFLSATEVFSFVPYFNARYAKGLV